MLVAGLSLGQSHVAWAGWSGQMNGLGYGRATANVTGSTGVPQAATSIITGPSADVQLTPQLGYNAFQPLPTGASTATRSLIKGSAGYIWTATTSAAGGDKTDNAALQNVPVTPQPGAFLKLDVTSDESSIFFNGIASGGTALLLRGFQWDGVGDPTLDQLQALADQSIQVQSFANQNDQLQTLADAGGFEPVFSQLIFGEGEPDPSTEESTFFTFPFPQDTKNFYLFVDGLAASAAVPDSGSCLGVFAFTVAGLILVRGRRFSHASA